VNASRGQPAVIIMVVYWQAQSAATRANDRADGVRDGDGQHTTTADNHINNKKTRVGRGRKGEERKREIFTHTLASYTLCNVQSRVRSG